MLHYLLFVSANKKLIYENMRSMAKQEYQDKHLYVCIYIYTHIVIYFDFAYKKNMYFEFKEAFHGLIYSQ